MEESLRAQEAEIAKLKRKFLFFGPERDGTISAEELADVLRSFRGEINEEGVRKVISTFDLDRDGKIGMHEFLLMMKYKETKTVSDSDGRQRSMQQLIRKALEKRRQIRRSFESFDEVVGVVVKYH